MTDNFTVQQFTTIQDYFGIGIPHGLYPTLLVFGLLAILGFIGWWRQYAFLLISTAGIALLSGVSGMIPIWSGFMAALFLMYQAVMVIFSTPANPTSETTTWLDSFSWLRYGKRMKRAYASKFGGDNSGFNEEVDLRIAVMRTQGKGETRDMATMWLKNQAQFVEIPWRDISDEGSQAEVEE